MSRKDYRVIAEVLAEISWDEKYEWSTVLGFVHAIADKLKADNPKFNKEVFLDYIEERA